MLQYWHNYQDIIENYFKGGSKMNKFFIISLLVIFCFTPLVITAEHSAIDKGSLEFGIGNVAELNIYRGDNIITGTMYGIGLTPDLTVGYFIIDRLSLGLTFGFWGDKDETMNEADTELNFSPFVKYYYPLSDKFLVNAKGFFGVYRFKDSTDPDNPFVRARFGFGIAGTYMLLPKLGGSIGVDFTYYSNYKVGGNKVDDTSFYIFDLLLGLTVYLR
jgi:hypothetical protein